MFTEYTREEIESPLNAKTQGSEGASLTAIDGADESIVSEENVNLFILKEYNNNEQFPYDLDGESLW